MVVATPHLERHFGQSERVRDVVIGMADGLTVPFALAAGLAGAVTNHWLIVIAGASELAAGSIAMGLGGYLAARGDADVYRAELAREQREIIELPDRETDEVREIFQSYGLTGKPLEAAVDAVIAHPETWVRFMMKEELGLNEPEPRRAVQSGSTIGTAYIAGGLVPMLPYAFPIEVTHALYISALLSVIALALFGATKAKLTGLSPRSGALQTTVLGGIAAAAAYAFARIIAGLANV